jgi:hypothetical protein
VQAWPKHQRPTRWIVDLARTRLDELRRELANRRLKGDSRFADSLQLMSFLTRRCSAPNTLIDSFRRPRRRHLEPRNGQHQGSTDQDRGCQRQGVAGRQAAETGQGGRNRDCRRRTAALLGTRWPQIAGLIARLADRPPEQEVWAILRTAPRRDRGADERVPD